MLASYRWLQELCDFSALPAVPSVEEIARRFTSLGLEVEGQKRYGDLPGVVISEVRAKAPHPSKDKLTVVTLFKGDAEVTVVCGASNVPEPGARVLLASVGATLPNGMAIAERKLAGVLSQGMICSEAELDIGADDDGIYVVPAEHPAKPGTPVSDAFGLSDVVLEIGLTPNRPDCLGHVGLARELCVSFGAALRAPLADAPMPSSTQGRVPVSISAPARCARYAACVVEGVKIAESPFWLRYRLHVLGLRAISNAVDITNLVLLEYGYPTHAFDLSKLRGGKIDVRTAHAGERIRTLDGAEHTLTDDDLLICDGAGPVAIAGVMGGAESGVETATRDVLVECAYFDPRSVRRTSRRLGIHSDASHRFERGVDPRAVPAVIARVVGLLSELAAGRAAGSAYEVYPAPVTPARITYRAARAHALLGIDIPVQRALEILAALGCSCDRAGDSLAVLAPTFRPDLTREEDLIEEVARVWGYDNIPGESLRVRPSTAGDSPAAFLRRLKERAAAVGLTEVVNYAFVAQSSLEKARSPLPAPRLANPLSQERSVLRTSLLPGIAANLQRAERHQVESVAIFELARVFAMSETELPNERHVLALALGGARSGWLAAGEPVDFFDGKGALASLLRPVLRAEIATQADLGLAEAAPYLHPRRSARVYVGESCIGLLGELHPDVLEALELSGPVVYAELEVAALASHAGSATAPQVRALPRFPASSRDLAVMVDEATIAGEVALALREAGGSLLEDVRLFDVYRGEKLPAGRKSLAFRLRYRDPDTTLTDARVDDAHGKVVKAASARFGAELRA